MTQSSKRGSEGRKLVRRPEAALGSSHQSSGPTIDEEIISDSGTRLRRLDGSEEDMSRKTALLAREVVQINRNFYVSELCTVFCELEGAAGRWGRGSDLKQKAVFDQETDVGTKLKRSKLRNRCSNEIENV